MFDARVGLTAYLCEMSVTKPSEARGNAPGEEQTKKGKENGKMGKKFREKPKGK